MSDIGTYYTKKWKQWCNSCKRHHIVSNQKCPSCGVYDTPQPVSEKVYSKCKADYDCDGCQAYRDHLK